MAESIRIHQHPDETTRTPSRSCQWLAETTIDGTAYSARSRNGAPYALARVLVEAGIADQPVTVISAGTKGEMTYKSLHAMAGCTIKEGAATSIQRVKWAPHYRGEGAAAEEA
jgi:hypothetical protein